MSTNDLSPNQVRFGRASSILKADFTDALKKVLEKEGITQDDAGLKFLDSKVATLEVIEDILKKGFPDAGTIPIKAAAMYLKGEDPFDTTTSKEQSPDMSSNAIIQYIQANKPIPQMSDVDLLMLWSKNKDPETESELQKRSKGQPFVVLLPGKHLPGKEKLDVELTLELLKAARKRTNSTISPRNDGTFATVYRITELNINERIIELCPICGEILWKGYCNGCDSMFANVGDDERAYVSLVANSGRMNPKSSSDRKALVTCAGKGIDALKADWPILAAIFDELKVTENLPKLKKIADRPSVMPTEIKDPFHVYGKRHL